MAMKDMHNDVVISTLIGPQNFSGNTAVTSEIIDLANYGSCEFALTIGAITDTDSTYTVLVQDGDNSALTDAADVADGFLLGTEALAGFADGDDNETHKIGYIGPKRYVRVTITPALNTGTAIISGVAILGSPRVLPQTSQG